MQLDVNVRGQKEALEAVAKATKRHADAFAAAVFVVASEVLSELLPQVPRRTGELVESRFVTRTSPVEVGFGAPHALAAHELGADRKFLQRPTSQSASTVPSRIARVLPRLLEAGATLQSVPAQHPTTPTVRSPAARARPSRPRRT